jgi:hypothetical protein
MYAAMVMMPGLLDAEELPEASLEAEALPEADALLASEPPESLEADALLASELLESLEADALLASEPLEAETELLLHAVSARTRITAVMAAIEINLAALEAAFTSASFLTWARAHTRLQNDIHAPTCRYLSPCSHGWSAHTSLAASPTRLRAHRYNTRALSRPIRERWDYCFDNRASAHSCGNIRDKPSDAFPVLSFAIKSLEVLV